MSFIHSLIRTGVTIGKIGVGVGKEAWNVGKIGMSATKASAVFSFKHPYAAIGIAGAGLYAAYGDKSPYSSPSLEGANITNNTSAEMEAYQNLNNGIAPTGSITPGISVRNQMLMESTNGLVQAMHNRRH